MVPRIASRTLFAVFLTLLAACNDSGGAGDGDGSPDATEDAAPADAGAEKDIREEGDAPGPTDTGETEDVEPADAEEDPDVGDTGEDVDVEEDTGPDLPPVPEDPRVYAYATGCYTVEVVNELGSLFVVASEDGTAFELGSEGDAEPFRLKPSDLATNLFYDTEGFYMVGTDEGTLVRQDELLSDIVLLDNDYLPGAQWVLEGSEQDDAGFQLRNLAAGRYLLDDGSTGGRLDAAVIFLQEAEGCAEHPELSLDATGTIERTTWEDGSVFGYAEPHTHLLSNFGFGGGGIFHGSAFHPLGVEHALPDCEPWHGPDGRADILGIGTNDRSNFTGLILAFTSGLAPDPDHNTAGYPDFTEWPNARTLRTHQMQYYRWVERSYLGGMRLLVQHATGLETLCELIVGAGVQGTRYSCEDMVGVDRQIEEAYRLERYIDAHHGGPGEGWFRIVSSPSEAREVIEEGRLAVVLGIEVSNLFECSVTPDEGQERCTEEDVVAALDDYQERGIRVLFPNHKLDNGFSPGDGTRGIFELANFALTGHWSNYTTEGCPELDRSFDDGNLQFGNLNQPREEYLSPAPLDMSNFASDPLGTVLAFTPDVLPETAEGEYCQAAALTDVGRFLIEEMMRRGIVVEIDHLPRRSYVEAFDLLVEHDYPAAGTHGGNNFGRLYELGGLSVQGFDTCVRDGLPRERGRDERHALIEAEGGMGAEPWSFDMNGLAGAPRPRFGDEARCSEPQEDPVTYPFTSYAGDITFTEPRAGNRVFDFNTEGLVHIGLLPEMVEDLSLSGVSQDALDDLFHSAEAYLRMWELSEARARELREE